MAADDKPIIRVLGFKTTYEMLPKRGTDPLNDNVDDKGYLINDKGRRIMDRVAEDWVTYSPAHSPLNTKNTDRVRHMIPDLVKLGQDEDGAKLAFMTARWSQIEPAYEAWKKGQELPVSGTPLSVWSGINPDQAEVFRQVGIRTVEEVRDLSELQLDRVRLPNMRDIRNQAKLFLENMGSSAAAEREAAMMSQMDAMREQMAEMQKAMAQQKAPAAAEVDEIAVLRAALDAKGISYDGRWAAPKLQSLLAGAEAA